MSENKQDIIARALAYPFDVPPASYVLLGETVLDLVSWNPQSLGTSLVRSSSGICSLAEEFARRTGQGFEEDETAALLASGSNASPQRLMEKFSGAANAVIPVLRGAIHRLCPVYSAHITRYGSVSATLQWAEAATAQVFCLLLPMPLLETMHRSEFVGANYGYFRLNGTCFCPDLGGDLYDPFAYLSLWGGLSLDGTHMRLSAYTSHGVDWPSLTQPRMMAEVHRLLAPMQGVEEFILSNVRHKALRHERIKTLSENHARPIHHSRFDRLK